MSEFISLRQASERTGIARHTLKEWLALAGFSLPKVPRGSKLMLRQSEIEKALATHSPQRVSVDISN